MTLMLRPIPYPGEITTLDQFKPTVFPLGILLCIYSIYVSDMSSSVLIYTLKHTTLDIVLCVWMPLVNTTLFIVFQISTNGHFSMGERPQYNSVLNFPVPNDTMIVAPYGADIDTSILLYYWKSSLCRLLLDSCMTDITNFIRTNTLDDFFCAKSMVVAEWDLVHRSDGQYVTLILLQN